MVAFLTARPSPVAHAMCTFVDIYEIYMRLETWVSTVFPDSEQPTPDLVKRTLFRFRTGCDLFCFVIPFTILAFLLSPSYCCCYYSSRNSDHGPHGGLSSHVLAVAVPFFRENVPALFIFAGQIASNRAYPRHAFQTLATRWDCTKLSTLVTLSVYNTWLDGVPVTPRLMVKSRLCFTHSLSNLAHWPEKGTTSIHISILLIVVIISHVNG